MWMGFSWRLWLGCLGWVVSAFLARADAERITHFDSRMEVQTNGTLAVVETIQVNALGQSIHHGIYRDFPELYETFYGLRYRTSFQVQSVRRDGQPEEYRLEGRANGVRVYMGSPSAYVAQGLHTYELSYTTDRQIGYLSDHDELYWNVTGNGWAFPIDAVTATVTLPAGATATILTAYTGATGERGRDFTAFNDTNTAHFTTTRPLPAASGLTIVVDWPRGFVTSPLPTGKWLALLADNPGLGFGAGILLLVLVYYSAVAMVLGREPKAGPIIPRSEPPEHLSPAAARHLWRMGFDNRAFAAAVLSLAVKGRIRIDEEKHRLRQRIYTLIPLRVPPADLPKLPALADEETLLLRDLFGKGRTLKLTSENAATIQAARKQLKRGLRRTQQGAWFVNHWRWCLPGMMGSGLAVGLPLQDVPRLHPAIFALVWLTIWTVGTGFLLRANRLFGAFFALFWFFGAWQLCQLTSWWQAGLMVAAIAINLAFYFRFKTRTLEGRRLMDQLEGFKVYLAMPEPERLNLQPPSASPPALFEKYLPYALALGVEGKWSEGFAGLLAAARPGGTGYAPDWYEGPGWNHLGPAVFTASLGGAFAGAIASAATAPGSGGGAGGSSGGGGGGGGGGGW